jgi:hypothetical protein
MIPRDGTDPYMEENREPHFSDIEPLPLSGAGTPRWVAVAFGLLTILTIFALVLGGRALRFSESSKPRATMPWPLASRLCVSATNLAIRSSAFSL